MSRILVAIAIAAGLWLPASTTLAQPGAPPAQPGEIADAWLLQGHGRVLCRLTLSGRATKAGHYGAEIPADCRDALPAGAAGWKPIPDGIALVTADGEVLVPFERWSQSLFVSSAHGVDLQLSRAPVTQGERRP